MNALSRSTLVVVLVLASASWGQGTLSHSNDSITITPGSSVACGGGGTTAQNSYWRVYDLTAFGAVVPIQVDSVTFGIEQATDSPPPGNAAEIRLYTDTDTNPSPMAGLTLVYTEAFVIPDLVATAWTVPMTTPPIFLASDIVVVELFLPDAGDVFYIGSNAAGQTDPSYLSATACGFAEPTDTVVVGAPAHQHILDLNTTVAGGPPPCTTAGVIPGVAPISQAGNTALTGTDQLTLPCGGNADDEIWRYTAPCDSNFTISLCGGGTAFNSVLAVYDMDPCQGGAAIACNNDFCGLQSEVTLPLTALTNYWIVVDGVFGASGPYQIDITSTGVIAGAIASVAPTSQAGDTSLSGTDQVVPFCGGNADDEVWTYVAPCDSTYTLSLCNGMTSYDTTLEIYDVDPCTGAAPLVCNDDGCGVQSEIITPLTGGVMYWIVVDGFNGDAGPYQLDITHIGCGVMCPPPAANCLACAQAYGFVTVEPDGAPGMANIPGGSLTAFASTQPLAINRTDVTITATPVDPQASLVIYMGLPGYSPGWLPDVVDAMLGCPGLAINAPGPGQPAVASFNCASAAVNVADLVWCTGNYAFWVWNTGTTSDVSVQVTTASSDACGCGPAPPCTSENLVEDVTVSILSTGSALGPQPFPYENDMESPAGFGVPGGLQDHRWELGVPTFGPPADHTRGGGASCLATDLDGGVFELLGEMVVTSPFVALPAGVPNPAVSFWAFNSSNETGLGDQVLGTVGIESASAPGTVLSIHPNRFVFGQFPIQPGLGLCAGADVGGPAGWWYQQSFDDPSGEGGWGMVSIDLSSFAGQSVRMHWNYRNLEDTAPGCFPPLCAAPGLLVDDMKVGYLVHINEILPGAMGSPDETWIELFSMHPTRINLAGWTLEVDDGSSTTITNLPAYTLRTYHGVVIHEGPSPFGVDQTWSHLWNSLTTAMDFTTGGSVLLRDASGRAVDFVRWGGNATVPPASLLWEESVPTPNPAADTDTVARTRTSVDTGSSGDFDVTSGADSAVPTPAYDNDDTLQLEIVSVTLVPGSVGAIYIDKLEAIGGTPPYTWALVGGTLPLLNGAMPWVTDAPNGTTGVLSTGMSTIDLGQEGLINLTVEVTDSLAATDTQDLVLTIGPLTPDMMTHVANAPDTGSGYTIDWQFRDTSSTETGFLIRDPMGIVVAGIGPTCPPAATAVTIPDTPLCHMATDTRELALAENTQYTRTAHSVQTQPSILQGIVINEIDLGQNDMVELYNYSSSDIDISGWVLNLNQEAPGGMGAPCMCGGGMPTMVCNTYSFPGGTILATGKTIRVYDNGNPAEDTAEVKNIGANWQPTFGSVCNIELANGGVLIDYIEVNGDYTCGIGTGMFAGFITLGGNNKAQRIVDRDGDTAADWRVEPVAGTPGSLNPGQAGLIIFNAESTIFDAMINATSAYSSVHDPLMGDVSFPSIGDFNIDIAIAPPLNPTADNSGIQVEFYEDTNCNSVLDGGEVAAPVTAWMSPAEGGAFLDPTNWSNAYTFNHTGLLPATCYCYRFRYRNGDGDPGSPGDETPWSPWSCAMTTSSCSIGTYLCGDCNGNGMNEITDSLTMAKIAVGLELAPAFGTDRFNACNVHGEVTPSGAADLTIIDALWNANYVVGRVPLACCMP